MNYNNIKTTIFKEIRGILRDKKSLRKIILYPLLIPFVILLFGFLIGSFEDANYVIGINYQMSEDEKEIVKDLDNTTFKEYSNESELENAYKNEEINGYIVKTDNNYVIYANESQNSGQMVISFATAYLESYNRVLGNNYLVENGIDVERAFNSIKYETKSVGGKEIDILFSTISNLIIAYIAMIIVMVSIVVVTDATSGEKERGTLETILTFPVRSSELILGKYIASTLLAFIVGLISYLLTIPSFYIGKSILSFEIYNELVYTTSFGAVILSIFIILLTSLLASGLCLALSGKAKTYKEAQSSLQFLTMLPMIPYFMEFMEIDNFIFNLIPIANCSALFNDVVANSIDIKSLIIIITSTIIYIVLIIVYISKQYKKEEILF